MSHLLEQPDVTDNFILAYDGLVDIIKRGPTSTGCSDTLSLNLVWRTLIRANLMATSFRMLRKVATYKQSTRTLSVMKAESCITV